MTVGIDVAPREEGLEESCAMTRRVLVEVIDESVLRPAQQRQRRGMTEIFGVGAPAVG